MGHGPWHSPVPSASSQQPAIPYDSKLAVASAGARCTVAAHQLLQLLQLPVAVARALAHGPLMPMPMPCPGGPAARRQQSRRNEPLYLIIPQYPMLRGLPLEHLRQCRMPYHRMSRRRARPRRCRSKARPPGGVRVRFNRIDRAMDGAALPILWATPSTFRSDQAVLRYPV